MVDNDPWGGSPEPFGGSGPVPMPAAPLKPPVVWLALSALAAIVGGLAAWFWGIRLLPAMLGWLVAGPVAIGLLARYVWLDTVRRAQPTHADYAWTGPGYFGCLVLAILATAVAAFEIAVWFGRGGGPVL